ncbi:MAG TPA: hypothetical protein VNE83_03335 [Terriglobales bacterium]|nr:hypothetical protein [Terriglobales bacterium]
MDDEMSAADETMHAETLWRGMRTLTDPDSPVWMQEWIVPTSPPPRSAPRQPAAIKEVTHVEAARKCDDQSGHPLPQVEARPQAISGSDPAKVASQVSDLPTRRLPFVLLPAGKHRIDEITEYFHKLAQGSGYFRGRKIDNARIEATLALRPAFCWTGEKAWVGYVVYKFVEYDRVIVDCPLEGNAAFVLAGKWQEMVRFSKAEIREEYAHLCVKIVHKGDWLGRLRAALQNRHYKRGTLRQPSAASEFLYRAPAEAAAARARGRGERQRYRRSARSR